MEWIRNLLVRKKLSIIIEEQIYEAEFELLKADSALSYYQAIFDYRVMNLANLKNIENRYKENKSGRI